MAWQRITSSPVPKFERSSPTPPTLKQKNYRQTDGTVGNLQNHRCSESASDNDFFSVSQNEDVVDLILTRERNGGSKT